MNRNAETFIMWSPITGDPATCLTKACQDFRNNHHLEPHTVYCHPALAAVLDGSNGLEVVPMRHANRQAFYFPAPAEKEGVEA